MEKEITFDRFIRWAGIALLVATVLWLVNVLSAVLLPFAVAWLFAYLLYPAVRFIETKMRVHSRVIAIVITLIFVAIILGLVTTLIIPPMIEQFSKIGDIINKFIHKPENNHVIAGIQRWMKENQDEIEGYLSSPDFAATVKSALPKVFSFLGTAASFILSIVASFITLLYMIFILLDYEKLSDGFIHIFPKKYRPFWSDLMNDVGLSLNNYLRGQGLVALIMGLMFCVGFTIMDFPLGIALGILIGIMDMVPYLHTLALIPTALLALMKAADTGQSFWVVFGMAVALFIIVQLITDLIVTPKVMGRAMSLNPAILLLSLSIWGALLGFIGLIIALPTTTLLITYYKRYVTREGVEKEADIKEKAPPEEKTASLKQKKEE